MFMCQCMWHVCEGEVGEWVAREQRGRGAKNPQRSHAVHARRPVDTPAAPLLFTRRVSPAWHAGVAACSVVCRGGFSGEVEGN